LKKPDGLIAGATHGAVIPDYGEAVWQAVSAEEAVRLAVGMLRERPTVSGIDIGKKIGDHFSQQWSPASNTRIGNAIRRWAIWVIAGEDAGKVPTPKAGRGDDGAMAER
jgi:hypothetical protein